LDIHFFIEVEKAGVMGVGVEIDPKEGGEGMEDIVKGFHGYSMRS